MAADGLLLIVGLSLLLAGGEALVRGASQIAVSTGVTPLVVGLTIVAFGTSAPELAVNVLAAWRGSGTLSFGNIFGSNMANIGLILGTAGLVRALRIQTVIVSREIPMMMVATAAAFVMSLDGPLDGGGPNRFDRPDGLVLLLFFSVFLYYTVGDVARQWDDKRSEVQGGEIEPSGEPRALARAGSLTVVGLVALVGGAELTVDGSIGLARALGVSEAIIGLTLVALGTSLPELATAVIATLRGHADLAVGNVVGSNIFNILLVAGATASIRPMEVPGRGHADLAVVMLLSVALWWVSATRERVIIRAEAAVLLAIYLLYVGWRSLSAG